MNELPLGPNLKPVQHNITLKSLNNNGLILTVTIGLNMGLSPAQIKKTWNSLNGTDPKDDLAELIEQIQTAAQKVLDTTE